jgi:hypothetical protein
MSHSDNSSPSAGVAALVVSILVLVGVVCAALFTATAQPGDGPPAAMKVHG